MPYTYTALHFRCPQSANVNNTMQLLPCNRTTTIMTTVRNRNSNFPLSGYKANITMVSRDVTYNITLATLGLYRVTSLDYHGYICIVKIGRITKINRENPENFADHDISLNLIFMQAYIQIDFCPVME